MCLFNAARVIVKGGGEFSFLGVLRYFKLWAFQEGLLRLMSYNLALHALVAFSEQVVPIHKHIALF